MSRVGFFFTPLFMGSITNSLKGRGGTGSRALSPPLPQDEKILITPLLVGLSTQFRLGLDTLPNLSRDATIFPPGSAPPADDVAALFIDGSNADRLANAAATLGIVTETVTAGGWTISTDAVTAILPQVIGHCESLPDNAPVIIYCLDNSSFCYANAEGQLLAIEKLNDDIYSRRAN
jgi:hypothetical protein